MPVVLHSMKVVVSILLVAKVEVAHFLLQNSVLV